MREKEKDQATGPRRKRRFMMRRKRTLDPSIIIDYKKPDILKRFVTERGKIIPRRISGATAKQQRVICKAIKRARFLSLIPSSGSHRPERGFTGEMSAMALSAGPREYAPRRDFGGGGGGRDFGGGGDRGERSAPAAAPRDEEE